MLTFREFYSICEGQKKEERQMLVRAYLAGTERATPPRVVNYGDSPPNSPGGEQFSEDLQTQRERNATTRERTLERHNAGVTAYRKHLQAQRDKEEEHQEILKKVKKDLL